MNRQVLDRMRRRCVFWIFGGGLLGPILFPNLVSVALALGVRNYPQGMQLVEGEVRVNNIPATKGSPVNYGDTIVTGDDGKAIVVMNRSVYLLRENTRLILSEEPDRGAKDKMLSIFKLLNGKVLSVFGKGRRRLETATAVIGVRGTAVYLESEPHKTYVCTCYGRVEIVARHDPSIREKVRTYYHDKPRFIYGPGADETLVAAPVINHTDAELIMLESMVGRIPPFMRDKRSGRYEDETGGSY